jgi:RNA polymerase sigma factor (sigma-70 family)
MSVFPTTRWTLVVKAQAGAKDALATLLELYWLPLYAFARRTGLSPEAAEDTVQDFLEHAIERSIFTRVDHQKGSLRAYLKTAFRHHLSDSREKAGAQKRGGNTRHEAIEAAERTLSTNDDPERAFDRQWAEGVMQRAMRALESDFAGNAELDLVRDYFSADLNSGYETIAKERGISVVSLKSLLHRARKRYREHLSAIVQDTLDDQNAVGEELDELLRAMER